MQDPAFDDPEMVNKWIDDCQAKDADRPHPWSQPATKAGDNQLQLQPAKRKRDWTNRRRGGRKYQMQKKSRQVDQALQIMGSLSRSLERSLHAHLPQPPPPPGAALPYDDDDDDDDGESTDEQQEVEWVD